IPTSPQAENPRPKSVVGAYIDYKEVELTFPLAMIIKRAWKRIWVTLLNTALSINLLTATVASISLLMLLQQQFENKFTKNIEGVDMVMGAKGSPLQLILSSVYQLDAPTGNINYKEAQTWMKHPFVETAIPLAFGDNYLGCKIVGTT